MLPSLLWTCGKAGQSTGPPPVASQLAFKVGAGSTTAGGIITPAVVIEARDPNGNLVSSFADPVTISLARNPGNGTLSGTTTVNAVGGVARFTNLSIDKSGLGYRLQATSGALSSGSGSKFDIVAGPPTHLAFAVEPGTDAAGTPIAPALQVSAQDSLGNVATTFTGLVTLAITAGTGTSGAVLSGPATLAASAGIATFAGISIDKVGFAYTFTATTSSLPSVTSAPFDVIAGPAAKVTFTQQPSTTTAGLTIAPAIEVTVRDAVGNVATGFNGTITVSITSGTGAFGATLSGTKTELAVAGIVTLADLSINKSAAGYTLSADATGLVSGVSAPFDILTGAVSQLSFSVQPVTATAGAAFAPAVQVSARDAVGNTVTAFTDTVTIALGANPTGGVLGGTMKVAASAGVATFADLSLTKAGNGYRLQAGAASWIATSNAFSVVAGVASQFSFAIQPTTTGAGSAITPAVQVAALDAYGNVATSYSGMVTVGLGANPGSGILSGSTDIPAIGGVATFATLSVDKLGAGYTLTATSGGLSDATSAPFDIVPGAATQLTFTVPPSTTVAGGTITPAVQVTALDAFGNTATGFNGTITVAIGTNPGGGGLSGTKAIAAVAGVATFPDLSIARNATGYTLTAKATGLTTATSPLFDILLGPVSQLVFVVQPASTPAGSTITPAVQVAAQDAAGNLETAFTDNVTLTIGVNPGGGTLSGTTTVAAVGGVATFNTLSIDKIGTGYRLAATSGSLNNSSNAFSIVSGAATHLVFSVQPVSTGAGAIITPAVVVTAQDALDNTATGFSGIVTVAIGNNPGSGNLAGTTSVSAAAGVATFNSLSIDKMGSGYTLTAAASALTGATSVAFDVTAGGATQLVFTVQPGTTTAGAQITPAVQVTAKDVLGNVATGFTGSVTVAIGTNPAGGTLAGTKSVTAVAGVATFSDLSINRNGTGYTLTAKATGLPMVTSGSFDILLGPMSQLIFTVQPTTTSAGTAIAPAIQVTAQDAAGNTVTSFTGNVTMSITVNPGGGTLSGTATRAAVAGIATFNDLSINKVGTGYRLLATSGSVSNSSGAFSITGGPAASLVFTVPPSTTAAGALISPAVKVTALDALGNTATGFTGMVTVVIGTNPSGGTLSGVTSLAAISGVATFSNLSINKVGSGYTLKASSSGLPTITSASFDIVVAPATKLIFSVQPSNTTAGATITPAIKVTAQDAQGNTVTTFTGNITVAIGANPSGGSLSGTKTVPAVFGVATFSDLSINRNGNGYTLTASSSGLAGATSNTFNILLGPLSQLAFTVQPTTTTATTAFSPAVQVTARDSVGNTITSFTSNVVMSISVNAGGGALAGTTTVAAVAGVATFNNLSINKVGTGYRLAATSGALNVVSNAFSILAGPATKLSFSVQPSTTGAGAVITPAVQVTALDAGGNTATGFISNVTMAIGTNPAGGTLSGTLTVGSAAGVATFTNLSINKLGTGYTLKATATGLTAATSTPFDIVVGAATQLAFTVQPATTTAGATITPAVKVTARDAQGNTVTSFTGNVTVAIGANPGGGSLSGTKTVVAAGGVATFSDLSINRNGTGYTLTASSSGLAGATSNTFNINTGPVVELFFSQQPVTTTATTALSPAVQVTARDSVGNTVTSFTSNVVMTISSNPGGGTLTGTTTVAAAAGVATFGNLHIDKVGTGYRLAATAGAVSNVSNAFSILAGAATHLAFTVQPANTTAGATITPAVEVTALDAGNNVATGFVSNVTIAIKTNPGAGTLSGTLTVAAASGVATFTDLSINNIGTGYTLTATSGGLTSATSSTFNIM
ncbi:MAG TPA: hypothetical protein VKB45_16485 [Gemmatimonadales bacterium]|nr:hypothetical protein [Gemmatimonadales bacterium]